MLTKVYGSAVFGISAVTIADLEGAIDIHSVHIAEAIQYRTMDRNTY